jgi:hypothetical protein
VTAGWKSEIVVAHCTGSFAAHLLLQAAAAVRLSHAHDAVDNYIL